jgi:hypothetical protein
MGVKAMNAPATQKPIPTRFMESETAFLDSLKGRYALPTSELIRRSVRLLRREMGKPDSEKLILSLVP